MYVVLIKSCYDIPFLLGYDCIYGNRMRILEKVKDLLEFLTTLITSVMYVTNPHLCHQI